VKTRTQYLFVAVIALLVLGVDLLLSPKMDSSVLIALLSWSAIGQGVIAMSAAADLSQGKWIAAIRPYLQQYYPWLLLFPLVFLVFSRHVAVYNWSHHPNGWLNPSFFIIRNTIALLLPFILAHVYVKASQNKSQRTGLFAVLYIFSFLVSQSFMAYDQVMTFEYPWINTLFGGYFFVEGLYGGIAFCAILAGILLGKKGKSFQSAYRDFTIMIMGFALLWAGLFYSQYLVIWYGNIPEEVSYLYKRMAVPSLKYMGAYVLATVFFIPFFALVSRKIKSKPLAVGFLSLLIFSGLLVERMIFIFPVAPHNPPAQIIQFLLLALPFLYLLFKQSRQSQENP